MHQGDEIMRLSDLVANHTRSALGILLNTHPASKHFASTIARPIRPTPRCTVLREECHHACHQPKRRSLSLLSLHPTVNSGPEKRSLKGNELTPEACRLLSPEPGAPGFPSQRIKEKDDRDGRRYAFPDPLFSVLLQTTHFQQFTLLLGNFKLSRLIRRGKGRQNRRKQIF